MTVQHKDIVEAQLHEPKGVSTAAVNTSYVANGAASGVWQKVKPPQFNGITTNGTAGQQLEVDGAGGWILVKHAYGMCYFENIAAPAVLAYPATFTLLAPSTTAPALTTTASGLGNLVTEGTNARLTYLGAGEIMDVTVNISLSQSIGADRDIRIALYKNGVKINGTVGITTTSTTIKKMLTGSAVVSMATNDYVECYVQNDGASGAISIYTFALFMDPH